MNYRTSLGHDENVRLTYGPITVQQSWTTRKQLR